MSFNNRILATFALVFLCATSVPTRAWSQDNPAPKRSGIDFFLQPVGRRTVASQTGNARATDGGSDPADGPWSGSIRQALS